MGKEMNAKIAKWLNDKFLDLQKQSGRRWTVTEFSEYLDCPQSLVSRWLMAKGIPGLKYIDNLARLGDDIYPLVNLPRPDPFERRVTAILDSLNDAGKQKVEDYAKKLSRQNQWTVGKSDVGAEAKAAPVR